MANSQGHGLHGERCTLHEQEERDDGLRSIVLLADAVCGPSATRLGLVAADRQTIVIADDREVYREEKITITDGLEITQQRPQKLKVGGQTNWTESCQES